MQRRLFFRIWLVWSFALGSTAAALRAEAEASGSDRAAAQALFDQAKDLMARGNSADACPKLEESERLDPTSGTLINLAQCYQDVGKTATAWSTFLQAAASAKNAGHFEREQVARERASGLVPRLSKLVINVASDLPGLEIKRNGVPVGKAQWGAAIPTDPGQYQLSASAPGRKPWAALVTVRPEGDNVIVTVPGGDTDPGKTTYAPAANGLDTQRALAIVAGGIGVAGLVTGGVFGLISKSKHDQANEHCDGATCRDSLGVDLKGQAIRAGNISTIALVVGAAGVAGGAALWFTAKPDSTTAARVGLGVGTIAVFGNW